MSDVNILLTVVVPILRRPQFIEKAMTSARNFIFRGESDDSSRRVLELVVFNPRLMVFHSES